MKSKKPYFTIIKSDLGREAVLAEDYALLLKHAEAMANAIQNGCEWDNQRFYRELRDSADAYRADFPKE